jgi:hypothetical protein
MENITKEIVVAAYDKSTDWLAGVNNEIKKTVYRKSNVLPLTDGETLIEPNLGRCVHSFFNHIYTNYDNLADHTFFVQDYPFDHWGDLIEVINGNLDDIKNKASLVIDGYYGFHNNTLGTAWNMPESKTFNGRALQCLSNGHPQDTNPLINVDKYWFLLFNEIQAPLIYEFIPGGHFVITKEHARLRSKEFYKKITELLIDDITAPWMIERLECYIFDTRFKTIL